MFLSRLLVVVLLMFTVSLGLSQSPAAPMNPTAQDNLEITISTSADSEHCATNTQADACQMQPSAKTMKNCLSDCFALTYLAALPLLDKPLIVPAKDKLNNHFISTHFSNIVSVELRPPKSVRII